MEWWQTLLMTAGTCFVTLFVTFIFNWFVNRPAKKKQEKAQESEKRKEELNEVKQELLKSIEDVRTEKIRERAACQEDHCALVKIVKDIQATNKAQNAGLQSVLKDLLKIRYLEWIKKGYAPLDARDDLEKMYQAYHKLGANGVMDNMRKQFLDLPIKSITTGEHKEENKAL